MRKMEQDRPGLYPMTSACGRYWLTLRGGDWHACAVGDTTNWGCGATPERAVANIGHEVPDAPRAPLVHPPLLGVGASLGPGAEMYSRQRAALLRAIEARGSMLVGDSTVETIVGAYLDAMREGDR